MMEIISPPTEVTQAFNPLPLRFKMHEMTSDDVHSPSPSPPGLESAHTGREDSLSASGSPNYPKASSASTIPYPSPPILPPLDLSSVPTSPEKDQGRTEKMGTDLAVDRSPLNDTTACDPSSESHSSPNPINYHSKCTDTTAPSAEDNGDSCSGENRQTKVPSTSTAESHPLCSEVVASSFVSDSPVNDWTQLLQNFAEFCQGKVKLPGQPEQETSGECNSKKPRVDEDGELGSKTTPSMDALSQFQAMFLSMGQMLFNSQTNPVPPLPPSSTSLGSPVKSGEDINETKEKLSTPVTQSDVQSTPLSLATSTYPVTGLTSPTSSSSGITRAPLPPSILPIPGMPNFPSPSSVPAGSEFGMSSQSPLAFTASLLAMLASQNTNMSGGKSIRPPQSLNEISPFGPPANLLLPNPFLPGPTSSHNASQGNHVPTGSFPPARVPPIFPNAPTNSCSAVPFFGPPLSSNKLPGLPDNRELLYQLGQQLMAMAAASGTPSDMGTKPAGGPWSSTNNNSSSSNNNSNTGNGSNTNNPNPIMESHSLSGFAPPNAPFLSNPMAAMIGSNLFGPQPFPMSNTAVSGTPISNQVPATLSQSVPVSGTSGERKSTGLMPNPVLDKGMHPGCLPGTGNSLSGISMRGNQKYSAYYQHQRKQGFHQLNANNMDYPSSGTSSRRQGTPLTTPLSGSRYASRRFRGNLAASGLSTHGVGLDTRGGTAGSNVPGGSRLPGVVRAPATAIFPGFRGTGPYGNNGGSVSVPSVNAMATTTTSNKQTIPNGGPGSKLQSPTDPMQLAAAAVSAGCTTTPSVNAMNSSGTSEPAATRHRDTAFLCSCGQDFESLYVFTLHMKDTGHKPKSDQSERDIPKLVRGQDMWINSETEQTREILRCMRCHQSFRNLPELTMHMMKTNHYSEIVYNDSGRLVFVNPDDPHHPHSRRGSANPNVASGGVSPAKSTGVNNSSGHWLGRRGSRGPAVTTPSNTSSLTPTNTNQTVPEVAPVSKSMPNRLSDPIARQKTDSSTDSNAELRDSQANKEIDFSEETDRTGPTSEPNKVRGMENTPQSVPTESQSPSHQQSKRASIDESTHPLTSAAERDSPMSTASIKPESMDYSDRTECSSVSPQAPTNKETNVLRQIETFVENNLPRTPKGLSVKVDQGSSSSSHKSASSPLATMSSDVSSRYSYGPVGCPMNSTSDSAKSSPSSHRKRTHSEASLSAHGSPVPSPASDQEKRSKPILTNETAGKIVIGVSSASGTASTATMPLTPTSPGVTSTTSEFASPLRENPLSSLQKLVETTHKPVPPSAAFSTPTGVTASSCFSLTSCVPNSLFVSCNGSGLKNATHSTSNNPTRISHTGGGNSSGPSSGPRSLGSPMDISGDSPFMTTNTGGSHSPGSQFAPIMLPATENENLIPALSALYAYVEKSSSNTSSITSSSATMQTGQSQHQHQNQQHHHHQQQQHNQHSQDTGIGHKPDYLSPNNAEEKSPSTDPSQCQQSQGSFNSPLDKITSSPALQAIYAAAMSSLAAQYLTAQQGSVRPTANLDPLEAFKQAATNFQAMLGEPKSDSADQAWLKMLQLFTGKPFQTDNECAESVRMSGTPDEEMGSIETEKRTNQSIDCAEVNRTQTRTPIQTQNTNVNSAATSTPFTTTTTTVTTGGDGNNNQNNVGTGRRLTGDGRAVDDRGCVRTPDSTKGADSISTVHSSPSPSKLSSSIDACSYANLNHMNARSIYTNSPNSYHPQLPNVLSGRYPSMQTRPIQNTTQSPALMTTMITKKAKCHFCGKPFANKGQVRLHISKNKCPCLLQQSCHVAALAAAFGSDSRPLTNANPAPSKSFLKDPMMGAKTRSSAEDFLASLSYPTTGANPIPGDSSDSAPSALSLLKERFQNFDLSHSPLRSSGGVSGSGNESKTSCSSYTGATKSSESDSLFAAAAAAASYASSTFGQALQSQPLMVPVNDGSTAPPVSWPFGAPPNLPLSAPSFTAAPGALTSSAGGGNPVTAAAANASHLAAMALLAQTLVQLTSSQTAQSSPFRGGGGPLPTVSGGSDSFSDPSAITAAAVAAAAAAQAPNRSLSTPTSSSATGSQNPISSIPLSPFMNSAAALNLDLLMNQTALMKQLASMTSWSDPNATRHRSEDESNAMSNPFLALSNCRNPAPNGLP